MNTSRPGWRTSEFWMALLLSVGSLAASAAGLLPPKWAALAAAASTSAYAIARGLSKFGANELVTEATDEDLVATVNQPTQPRPPDAQARGGRR